MHPFSYSLLAYLTIIKTIIRNQNHFNHEIALEVPSKNFKYFSPRSIVIYYGEFLNNKKGR